MTSTRQRNGKLESAPEADGEAKLATPNPPRRKKRAKTHPPDIHEVRNLFQQQLPMMIGEAMDAYQSIINGSDEQDHKLSAARHSAARTALAHIQQLVRLCEWARNEAKAEPEEEVSDMDQLIAKARQRIKASEFPVIVAELRENSPFSTASTMDDIFEDDEEGAIE